MQFAPPTDSTIVERVEQCDLVAPLGRESFEGTDEGIRHFSSIATSVAGEAEVVSRMPSGARQGPHDWFHNAPGITDLMTGEVAGRNSPEQITFFHTSGTQGLQFAAAAGKVYEEARKRGMGRDLPTDWFLETIRD